MILRKWDLLLIEENILLIYSKVSRVCNLTKLISSFLLANLKFQVEKKDTALFLRDGIPEDLVIELRNLDVNVSNINRDYSLGERSPEKVKSKTKVEILQLLDERDRKILRLLNDSNAKTLYKLLNLSSEYVDPIHKKRLSDLTIIEVKKIFNGPDTGITSDEDRSAVIKTWKKKYLKTIYSILKPFKIIR